MHFTPRPRWLMIVSTAMVVLPVLRSPMISSRWPRPTGVMASMALMPVCSGWCTGWRPKMPGAWISMRRSCTPDSAPPPSTGLPRPSTTRPSRPSPTGTDRMRPVALTVWPSLTPAASPSTTAPIDSSSRLRARPTAPLSNSSSSLTAASGSPATVAMPSPTSATRPTCAVETSGLKSSRFLRSAAAMSAVLMVSSAIGLVLVLLSSECVLQLVEPAADRSVDHGVAHLGDDAAEHRRVDHDLDLDLLAGGVAEGLGQPFALVIGERDRRTHLGDLLVGLSRAHLDELADDGWQRAGPAGADHHRDQGHRGRRGPAAQQVFDDLLAPGCGDARIGEGLAQLVVALQGLREAEQLVLDLTEGALGPGHAEEGLGVGERAIDCHLGVLLVGLLGRGAAVRPHERCAAIWLM